MIDYSVRMICSGVSTPGSEGLDPVIIDTRIVATALTTSADKNTFRFANP